MSKYKRIHYAIVPIAILSLALLYLVGCSSKSVTEETPEGSTVSVTASPSSVPKGSTSVIEATVENGSVGLPNQVVTFSVNPTSAGYFTPAADTTDADGIAATVFTATTSGTASIGAAVSGTSITGSVGITVTESQQGGSGNVDISVSPSLLLANGSDTSIVTITVRDDLAQPAPDQTLLKIVAGEKFIDLDENGYWSQGIDSLVFDANANGQWDAIGLIPSTAHTSGGTGTAVVNFISGNEAQTVYIKATVDDNGIKGSDEVALQLSPDATINSIYLSSDSINLCVKQTGGIESALLYATGYDVNTNRVPEGLTINFIITDGPHGGEHLGTVGYGPYQAVTNGQGVATASIHSGTVSGTIRVRAYADTVLSNATQVMVSAGPPAHIAVGSEYCNIDYWDNCCDPVKICAVVSDIYMNPVNDNTAVYFTTDEGTMKSHEERTQDLEGKATTFWFAGTNVPTADGRVFIMAETAGGTVADTSMFYNTNIPDTLVVTGVPASMPADGITRAVVFVSGFDLNGNPVVSGTQFHADATYLKVQGGILEDGCYSSSARGTITSTTLQTDNSLTGANDDGVGAYDVVYYWACFSSVTSFTVALTTGSAYRGNCSINGPSSAAVGEVAFYSVTVSDRFGNPLGDHTLNMTASGGVVTGASQETDGYGEANGFIWTAPAAAGEYNLTVIDTDPKGGGISLTKKVTVE
jgi:hypothetical protein